MTTSTITIPVDPATARAYSGASAEDRLKMQVLLGLRLRELTESGGAGLKAIMDETASKAEARGLTPSLLETLLRDHG